MANHIGKSVGNRLYIHIDALRHLPKDEQHTVEQALMIAGDHPIEPANVVRIEKETQYVAFLHYPNFFDTPFPSLKESWRVDTIEESVSYRTYEHSLNPPILHRKELLIPQDHPRSGEYQALTESAESMGLFDDTTRIGYQVQWNHLIRERGYELVGHQLSPIGNDVSDVQLDIDVSDNHVYRHRTALVRYDLSAPIKSLARHGLLDDQHTLFDYGCGRGDDIRGLTESGIEAQGWDPYYAPKNDIHRASIVNLGFVINVIEDFDERIEALSRAYSLADTLLVVSVMIAADNSARGILFNDGVVTQRRTFQKYYTQPEICSFIEEVLDERPIPIAPGIFYVFSDKDAEQRFLVNRYRSRRNRLRSSSYNPTSHSKARQLRDDVLYDEHKSMLESLWNTTLSLGRKPEPTEATEIETLIDTFGTLNKAWRFINTRKDPEELEHAQETRIADLSVYLALREFEERKAYRHLEHGLKRDIKVFFGTIRAARETANQLLFSIGCNAAILDACQYAVEHGLGYLDDECSLQLHTSMAEQLPSILRVYCGCATALYGDYRSADLIKIHTQSGKLTLMKFDNFEGSPLPRMTERVKLKLREQDLEYYSYDTTDYPPPYLYHKSRYINEEYPNYPEQVDFDRKLTEMDFIDLSGYGPSPDALHYVLEKNRWVIDGFQLSRSKLIPNLDASCGKYLTFRDLIECGKTQEHTGIANLPKEPDTYSALLDLAINILDPIIDYFGMIKLTYGFCSPELEKNISKGIAPRLDQHACHEKRRTGKHICMRKGAAVDLLIEDEDMREVARWVSSNTEFDRLYYYGSSLPIHISFGPENSQQAFEMLKHHASRVTPTPFK